MRPSVMGELTKQGEVSHYWPVNPSGWKNELGDLNSRANFLISYPLLEKIKINPPNSMSYQALTLYWTWNRYLLWSEHLGPGAHRGAEPYCTLPVAISTSLSVLNSGMILATGNTWQRPGTFLTVRTGLLASSEWQSQVLLMHNAQDSAPPRRITCPQMSVVWRWH